MEIERDLESGYAEFSSASMSTTNTCLERTPESNITSSEMPYPMRKIPGLHSEKSPELYSEQIRNSAWSYCNASDDLENVQRGCPSYEYLFVLSSAAYRHELNQFMAENRQDMKSEKKPVLDAEYLARLRAVLDGYCKHIGEYHKVLTYPLDNKFSQQECQRRKAWDHMCPEAPLPPFDRFCKFRYIPTETLGSFPRPKEDPIREFFKRILPRQISFSHSERITTDGGVRYSKGLPPRVTSSIVDRLARFSLACLAGLALIVPMLILILAAPSEVTSLVTISVSVLLFASFISLVSKSSNQEILVSTATYAAVLMVFVGASGSQNTN